MSCKKKTLRYIAAVLAGLMIGEYPLTVLAQNGQLAIGTSISIANPVVQDLLRGRFQEKIPSKNALFKTFVQGGTNLVVLIEDPHANFIGQKNLSNVIQSISSEYNAFQIFVEGGSGDVSLNRLKHIASNKAWKQIAEQELMRGNISGEEYLSLVSDLPLKLIGVEHPDKYRLGVDAYRRIYEFRETDAKRLHQMRRIILRLKNIIYPKELLEFESSLESLDAKNSPILEAEILIRMSDGDLSPYPALKQMLHAQESESRMDFQKAQYQFYTLVRRLNLDAVDLTGLSDERKAEIIEGLVVLSKEQMIPGFEYDSLQNYLETYQRFKKANPEQILSELEVLRAEIYKTLLKTDDAEKIYAISRLMDLFENGSKVMLQRIEYLEWERRVSQAPELGWIAYLNRKLLENEFYEDFIQADGSWEDLTDRIQNFYSNAVDREVSIVRNIQAWFERSDQATAFLVTGGFHTDPIVTLLARNGFSVAVVTPKVESETDRRIYEGVLLGGSSESQENLNKESGTIRPLAVMKSKTRRNQMVLAAARLSGLSERQTQEIVFNLDSNVSEGSNFQSIDSQIAAVDSSVKSGARLSERLMWRFSRVLHHSIFFSSLILMFSMGVNPVIAKLSTGEWYFYVPNIVLGVWGLVTSKVLEYKLNDNFHKSNAFKQSGEYSMKYFLQDNHPSLISLVGIGTVFLSVYIPGILLPYFGFAPGASLTGVKIGLGILTLGMATGMIRSDAAKQKRYQAPGDPYESWLHTYTALTDLVSDLASDDPKIARMITITLDPENIHGFTDPNTQLKFNLQKFSVIAENIRNANEIDWDAEVPSSPNEDDVIAKEFKAYKDKLALFESIVAFDEILADMGHLEWLTEDRKARIKSARFNFGRDLKSHADAFFSQAIDAREYRGFGVINSVLSETDELIDRDKETLEKLRSEFARGIPNYFTSGARLASSENDTENGSLSAKPKINRVSSPYLKMTAYSALSATFLLLMMTSVTGYSSGWLNAVQSGIILTASLLASIQFGWKTIVDGYLRIFTIHHDSSRQRLSEETANVIAGIILWGSTSLYQMSMKYLLRFKHGGSLSFLNPDHESFDIRAWYRYSLSNSFLRERAVAFFRGKPYRGSDLQEWVDRNLKSVQPDFNLAALVDSDDSINPEHFTYLTQFINSQIMIPRGFIATSYGAQAQFARIVFREQKQTPSGRLVEVYTIERENKTQATDAGFADIEGNVFLTNGFHIKHYEEFKAWHDQFMQKHVNPYVQRLDQAEKQLKRFLRHSKKSASQSERAEAKKIASDQQKAINADRDELERMLLDPEIRLWSEFVKGKSENQILSEIRQSTLIEELSHSDTMSAAMAVLGHPLFPEHITQKPEELSLFLRSLIKKDSVLWKLIDLESGSMNSEVLHGIIEFEGRLRAATQNFSAIILLDRTTNGMSEQVALDSTVRVMMDQIDPNAPESEIYDRYDRYIRSHISNLKTFDKKLRNQADFAYQKNFYAPGERLQIADEIRSESKAEKQNRDTGSGIDFPNKENPSAARLSQEFVSTIGFVKPDLRLDLQRFGGQGDVNLDQILLTSLSGAGFQPFFILTGSAAYTAEEGKSLDWDLIDDLDMVVHWPSERSMDDAYHALEAFEDDVFTRLSEQGVRVEEPLFLVDQTTGKEIRIQILLSDLNTSLYSGFLRSGHSRMKSFSSDIIFVMQDSVADEVKGFIQNQTMNEEQTLKKFAAQLDDFAEVYAQYEYEGKAKDFRAWRKFLKRVFRQVRVIGVAGNSEADAWLAHVREIFADTRFRGQDPSFLSVVDEAIQSGVLLIQGYDSDLRKGIEIQAESFVGARLSEDPKNQDELFASDSFHQRFIDAIGFEKLHYLYKDPYRMVSGKRFRSMSLTVGVDADNFGESVHRMQDKVNAASVDELDIFLVTEGQSLFISDLDADEAIFTDRLLSCVACGVRAVLRTGAVEYGLSHLRNVNLSETGEHEDQIYESDFEVFFELLGDPSLYQDIQFALMHLTAPYQQSQVLADRKKELKQQIRIRYDNAPIVDVIASSTMGLYGNFGLTQKGWFLSYNPLFGDRSERVYEDGAWEGFAGARLADSEIYDSRMDRLLRQYRNEYDLQIWRNENSGEIAIGENNSFVLPPYITTRAPGIQHVAPVLNFGDGIDLLNVPADSLIHLTDADDDSFVGTAELKTCVGCAYYATTATESLLDVAHLFINSDQKTVTDFTRGFNLFKEYAPDPYLVEKMEFVIAFSTARYYWGLGLRRFMIEAVIKELQSVYPNANFHLFGIDSVVEEDIRMILNPGGFGIDWITQEGERAYVLKAFESDGNGARLAESTTFDIQTATSLDLTSNESNLLLRLKEVKRRLSLGVFPIWFNQGILHLTVALSGSREVRLNLSSDVPGEEFPLENLKPDEDFVESKIDIIDESLPDSLAVKDESVLTEVLLNRIYVRLNSDEDLPKSVGITVRLDDLSVGKSAADQQYFIRELRILKSQLKHLQKQSGMQVYLQFKNSDSELIDLARLEGLNQREFLPGMKRIALSSVEAFNQGLVTLIDSGFFPVQSAQKENGEYPVFPVRATVLLAVWLGLIEEDIQFDDPIISAIRTLVGVNDSDLNADYLNRIRKGDVDSETLSKAKRFAVGARKFFDLNTWMAFARRSLAAIAISA